jgi:NAD(P)-dependent dehydrogenase (short-subunit alcohol dehydrogenase family)
MNAGIYSPNGKKSPFNPENGLCRIFTTNHLGHFALFQELETTLVQTGLQLASQPASELSPKTARLVVLSSDAHRMVKRWKELENVYDATLERSEIPNMVLNRIMANYALSKLCNSLFALQVQARMNKLAESNSIFKMPPVVAASCNPGMVDTGILDGVIGPIWLKLMFFFGTTLEAAAAQSVFLATNPIVDKDPMSMGGAYWQKSKPYAPSKLAQSKDLASDLWDLSEDMVSSTPLTRDRVRELLGYQELKEK